MVTELTDSKAKSRVLNQFGDLIDNIPDDAIS